MVGNSVWNENFSNFGWPVKRCVILFICSPFTVHKSEREIKKEKHLFRGNVNNNSMKSIIIFALKSGIVCRANKYRG